MILRGLTLWRPWAASIVHGPKRVENRPWAPPVAHVRAGLWIALHAGQRWDEEGASFITDVGKWKEASERLDDDECDESCWPYEWAVQGIVGVARVERVWKFDSLSDEGLPGMEWAFGTYCWDLADVRALPEPIPCRGRQMLWTLPAEIEARLLPLCAKEA